MGGDGGKIKARTGGKVRAREEAAAGGSGKAGGEKRQPAGVGEECAGKSGPVYGKTDR